MARILLLMTTQTYRAKAFLQAARRLGVAVTVGTERRSVLAKLTPGATIAIDVDHPEYAARQIADFAREYPLDAIIGIDEATAVLAARAAAAIGLPANSVESVTAAHDKHQMRRLLTEAGVPSPPFRLVAIDADPVKLAAGVRFPCVVKPVALAGSRGVIRADDPRQFFLAFRRAAAIVERSGLPAADPAARHLLIEDYVPGVEVALEGLIEDGAPRVLALFDKPDPLEGPFFEETIYVTPSRLPAEAQTAIARCTADATRALGLHTGPVHAELRLNDQGPWIIEVAARSIGGLCSNMLRFGMGISLEELILRQALGEEIAEYDREGGGAGAMMIPIPRGGVLRRIGGREAAAAVPGIEEVALTVPVGQRLVPLPEGSQYLGFLIARTGSAEEAEAALREAHRRLEIEIVQDSRE